MSRERIQGTRTSTEPLLSARDVPLSAMHDPVDVSRFVDGYLSESGTEPRHIGFQVIAVRTAQAPMLVERLLKSLQLQRQATSFGGIVKVVVVDDSWEEDAVSQTKEASQRYGADYQRVRSNNGFTGRLLSTFLAALDRDPHLSVWQKRRKYWLARAALGTGLATPVRHDVSDPRIQEPLRELGGFAGAGNLGLLLGAYEAGREGVQLQNMALTVNDDDVMYQTICRTGEGSRIEAHDWIAERAAWLRDPKTIALTGRYVGHRGNPISLVKDTLQVVADVVEAVGSGRPGLYSVFDEQTGRFVQRTAAEVYTMLPDILAHASRRHPVIGLTTKDMRYREPQIRWDEAARLEGGNLTVAGDNISYTLVPHGGIYDYLMAAVLRVRSMLSDAPNRVVRRQESMFHRRIDRPNGGGAFSGKLLKAIDNPDSRQYGEMQYVIAHDPRVQARIMTAFNIPVSRSEMVQAALRSEFMNFQQLTDITKLRDRIIKDTEDIIHDNVHDAHVAESVADFAEQFSDRVIADSQQDLYIIPDERRVAAIRKGILRWLDMYELWPELVETAYALGQHERRTQGEE